MLSSENVHYLKKEKRDCLLKHVNTTKHKVIVHLAVSTNYQVIQLTLVRMSKHLMIGHMEIYQSLSPDPIKDRCLMFFKQSDSGSVFVLPFANLTICCSMDEKILYVLEILCSCHDS